MDKEQNLRKLQDRGQRTAIAMKELADARMALEKQCMDTFRQSDLHDTPGHRACRYYLRVLDDVFQRFENFVRSGEDARKELVRMKPTIVERIKGHG